MSVQIETDTHVNIMMCLFEYIYASNQVIVQLIFGQLQIISFLSTGLIVIYIIIYIWPYYCSHQGIHDA